MAAFDFITNEEFRAALEADQAELLACVAAKSWKAVHVLAGSIIEAVLLDYLVASEYQKSPLEDLLKMDLHKAIDACLAEGVLTSKTAQLSVVVKDYRNLIHPGRSVRLSEKVDENSAKVAQSLVEMIVAEVAKSKSEKYGNTAEQLAAKVVVDPSAVGILDHLLDGMKELEIERLLLKVIPDQHFFLLNEEPVPDDSLEALRHCYRAALRKAGYETKKKVTEKHVKVLKEEGEAKVVAYIDAFVRVSDLITAQYDEREIIKDHLLSRLGRGVTGPLLEALEGIGQFLMNDDLSLFLWPLTSAYALGIDEKLAQKAKDRLSEERLAMESYVVEESKKVVDGIIGQYDEKGYGQKAVDRAREIKAVLDAPRRSKPRDFAGRGKVP